MFRTSALVLAALLATSTDAVRLESMMMKGSGKGGESDAAKGGDDKPAGDDKEGEDSKGLSIELGLI